MGHIFDLGHTENGIMGNDYQHSRFMFAPENIEDRDQASTSTSSRCIMKYVLTDDGQTIPNAFRFTESCTAILLYHRSFRMLSCSS